MNHSEYGPGIADDPLVPGKEEFPAAPGEDEVEQIAKKLGAPTAEKDNIPLDGD